ncbi:MAG: M48 family metallopeptidase [Verrucomicrobiota bacterium]
MDFFEKQDRARANTKFLIFYFVLAIVGIIAGVYLVAVVTWACAKNMDYPTFVWWDPMLLLYSALGVGIVIASGTIYKIIQLRQGGRAVAMALGGRPVDLHTQDLHERKLLNVVEEMALASGVPSPEVFVLEDEEGINAFAAGHSTGDAAVAVTRGCMTLLSRDELQGVVAHEFSHILNGDMRLNIRLMGLLHGILCIALIGYAIVRGSARSGSRGGRNRGGGGILIGMALAVIGYIGVFFAKLIKSAVSRQREFLADASAVQFTRNPGGIIGALKKIGGLAGGSKLTSSHAEEASHMFFANGLSKAFFDLMATHPPLVDRIAAMDPHFDGVFMEVDIKETAAQASLAPKTKPPVAPKGGVDLQEAVVGLAKAPAQMQMKPEALVASAGTMTAESLSYAQSMRSSIPEMILNATREIFGARAVIYGLLLNRDAGIRKMQIEQLAKLADTGVLPELNRLLPVIDALDPRARLPLVDLAVPALKLLSQSQYIKFLSNVHVLIEADQAIELFEYTLQKIVAHHLGTHFGLSRPAKVRFESLKPILPDCVVLLSALANLNADENVSRQAFDRGLAQLNITLGGSAQKLSYEQATLTAVDAALHQLSAAAPLLKKNILYACATTVIHDGAVVVEELELLRAIAAVLDCPIPPFIEESVKS